MLHECNLQCVSLDLSKLEALGMEDKGKWMPFIIDMECIEAAKFTSDEEDDPMYGCTSIYTKGGDTYIIDTPYKEFFKKFKEFYYNTEGDTPGSDNDIDL